MPCWPPTFRKTRPGRLPAWVWRRSGRRWLPSKTCDYWSPGWREHIAQTESRLETRLEERMAQSEARQEARMARSETRLTWRMVGIAGLATAFLAGIITST